MLKNLLLFCIKALRLLILKITEPFHKLGFFLKFEYGKKTPRHFNYFGFRVFYQKGDGSVNHLSRGYRYESDLLKAASAFIGSNTVVFDVGANIGLITLALLAQYPRALFHCFEPSPYPYKYFSKTIKENNLGKNIILNKLALYSKKGRLSFSVHNIKDALGDGILDTGRAGKSKKIYVRATTLDDYVKINKIARIDMVKIDVEGGELSVLKGGSKSLIKFRPVLLFEANPKNMLTYKIKPADIHRFLISLNYQIYDLKSHKLGEKEFTLLTAKFDNFLAQPQ